jgi:hypothetical protein
MKYLILNFDSAKLFVNSKNMGIVINNGIRIPRTKGLKFVEPITKYQIANMLAVLFGDRPRSTLWSTIYPTPRHDYFTKMAENSFLNISTPKFYNKTKDVYYYPKETLSSVKAVHNSWISSVVITWEILRRYCVEDSIFAQLVVMLENILQKKNITEIPLTYVRDELSLLDISSLTTFLKEKKLLAFIRFIKDDNGSSLVQKENNSALTITNGIEYVINLRGKILVPVSEEDLESLSNAKGTATLLDGGVVWIDSIKKDYQMSEYKNFNQVGEISLETNY